MRRFLGLSIIVIVCLSVVAVQAARQGDFPEGERLHVQMSFSDPLGLQVSAFNIERDRGSSIMHLEGDSEIRVWPVGQPAGPPPDSGPYFVHVLRADEVDVNVETGEIVFARGNIRLTTETP